MLTKLNFWPEKVYFRLSLCYIDEWRDGWWLERQIFALSSGNGLQHYRRILLIQPVSLRSRLRLKFIDIPYPTSMERLEWRRALVPFGYQSHWCLEESALPKKDNIYSSSFFLQKNTQKPTHPILKDTNVYRVLHTCGYLTVLFANELGDRTEGFVLRNARLSKSTENPDLLLLPFSSPTWLI